MRGLRIDNMFYAPERGWAQSRNAPRPPDARLPLS